MYSCRGYMRRAQIDPIRRVFPKVKLVEAALDHVTVELAADADAVCLFVDDECDTAIVARLAEMGCKAIFMRCAGYDRVNVEAATASGMRVFRVPGYSPYAVAEHAVALMMVLNRQLIKCDQRVQQGNFALSGLVGFDMHGKTVGLIGTGKIGRCCASILLGMGCTVIASDPYQNEEAINMGIKYVDMDELLARSRIITLHCPLMPSTRHIINRESISKMQDGVMLINASRGALVDTKALIEGLDTRKIGALGMDVYEHEQGTFFTDWSSTSDDMPGASVPENWDYQLGSLAARPNVIVTPHAAFLTQEALTNIADTTVMNLKDFIHDRQSDNEVFAPYHL